MKIDMMKKLKYILIGVLLMGVGFTGCSLEDNIDPKRATEVPAETLFTQAQISFVDQYNSMSVNNNISHSSTPSQSPVGIPTNLNVLNFFLISHTSK